MEKLREFEVETAQHWEPIAKELLDLWEEYPVIAAHGDLGAGKTTLMKSLMRLKGYSHPVTSPTFGFVQEYPTEHGVVYHLDLYRLETIEDLLELGIEDLMWEEASRLFVEWPELLESIIAPPYVKINIEILADNRRKVVFWTVK